MVLNVFIVFVLWQKQLEEEENLARNQQESLKGNYKKYEMMDALIGDGTAKRLARHYNMNLGDH